LQGCRAVWVEEKVLRDVALTASNDQARTLLAERKTFYRDILGSI